MAVRAPFLEPSPDSLGPWYRGNDDKCPLGPRSALLGQNKTRNRPGPDPPELVNDKVTLPALSFSKLFLLFGALLFFLFDCM